MDIILMRYDYDVNWDVYIAHYNPVLDGIIVYFIL